jgi:ABC-type multidrug transport system fused ATPase/permease subunit
MRNVFKKFEAILDRKQKRDVIVLLALMMIGVILETLGVSLVVPVLALISNPTTVSHHPYFQRILGFSGNIESVGMISAAMGLLVVAYAFKVVFLAFLAWRQAVFIYGLDADLSERLFRGYLFQPYTFHMQRNSALLIRHATGEVSQFTTGVSAACTLLTELLILTSIAVLLLWTEPLGASVVVFTLGASGIAFHMFARNKIRQWGEGRQFHEVQRLKWLQQGLGGVKDVKVFGREIEFVKEYSTHLNESAKIGRNLNLLQALPRLWLELMAVSGLAMLVVTMLFQNKPTEYLVPTLGLFAAAAFRLMPSVSRLLGGLQTLSFNMPVIDTLYNERIFLIEPNTKINRLTFNFTKTIRLLDVVFYYPQIEVPQLDGINISINKGAVVGIIGSSGAGKSTLIDLLLGLLRPSSGRVLVDELDIQSNLRGWQEKIGYVPQTIYLTDDSIRRNIAFGIAEEEISDEKVKAAIELAQLADFIASIPDGEQTIIGERGVRLSGGQRQRIGIARALYHNPELLILDEASSALDLHTEGEVMQAVLSLRGKKTVMIVAHRLSTVATCDWIYKIEAGRVMAEGPPEQIL